MAGLTQPPRGAFLAELHRGVLDKRHPLDREETIIGRDSTAHIRVDDGSVSRQHAAIRKKGDRWVIYDLGSRNGITINEKHLRGGAHRDLKVNDCIFLGKSVFCFLIAEDKQSIVTDSDIDAVTDLPRRKSFLERLGKEMAAARADHRPLGLFFIGIEDMPGINERFTMRGGDAVLRQAAEVLTASLQPREYLARYRGAVFALIAPDLLDGQLLERGMKLRERLEEQPVLYENDLILIQASVGITPMMALDQEKLIEAADVTLSRAKKRGSAVERASRSPDAETENFKRRLVPLPLFAEWLKTPAIAFVIQFSTTGATRSRQIIDFEVHAAVQQNLSGDELATFPDSGGSVLVTVPHTDQDRLPRLCEAIRLGFDQALMSKTSSRIVLDFGAPRVVHSADEALALIGRRA